MLEWLRANQAVGEWLAAFATAAAAIIALTESGRSRRIDREDRLQFMLAALTPLEVSTGFAARFANDLLAREPAMMMARERGDWGFDFFRRMAGSLDEIEVARMPTVGAIAALHEGRAAFYRILSTEAWAQSGNMRLREDAFSSYMTACRDLADATSHLKAEIERYERPLRRAVRLLWQRLRAVRRQARQ